MYPPGLHRVLPKAVAFVNAINVACSLLVLPGAAALWQKIWLGRHQGRVLANFAAGTAVSALAPGALTSIRAGELLRCAAGRLAAADRPKDFAGTEDGVLRSAQVASMLGQACGPSLLTGGQWTAGKLFLSRLSVSSACVRCGCSFETLSHRLWECPDDSAERAELYSKLRPEVILPNCLKRCGLAPVNTYLTQSEVCLAQQYLLCVAAKATRALALEHPDRVELAEPSSSLSDFGPLGFGPLGLGSSSAHLDRDEFTVSSDSASGLGPFGLGSSVHGFPSDPNASAGSSCIVDVLRRPPPWPSEGCA